MYTGIVLIAGLIGGYALIQSKQAGDISQSLTQADTVNIGKGQRRNQTEQPSRGNCLSDDCLYVDNLEYPAGELSPEAKDALDEAINDEYKALATYEAVIAKLGAVRPFSMIKGAEEQHIASLKAVYDKYGLIVPENSWASKVTAPSTLKEACQIGVDAEIANAKLYKDKLLPAVSQYVDIENVFTNLMNASEEKHLPAFERCN
jgi:hypothetical protein